MATMLDPAEAMKVFFKQVPELALATQTREQIRVGINIQLSARHHQGPRHGDDQPIFGYHCARVSGMGADTENSTASCRNLPQHPCKSAEC